MANYRAIATGNWNTGSTWAGGSVPPNGQGHNIYSNTYTVTIDTNVEVALITNAVNAGTFVGGGTAAAGGGFTVSAFNPSITANITGAGTVNCLVLTGTQSATLVGNISGGSAGVGMHGIAAISLNTTGSLGITGNIIGSTAAQTWAGHGINLVLGNLIINGNVTAGLGGQGTIYGCHGINSSGSGILTLNGNVFGNSTSISGVSGTVCRGIQNSGAGVISVIGNCTAGTGTSTEAIFSSNASATISVQGQITAVNGVNAVNCIGNSTTTFSGTLTSAADGTQPIYSTRYRISPTPLNAKTRYAANGTGTYVDFFTADNTSGITGVATTDVRSGVSYGGGLVGTCAVPAAGSVSLGVPVGSGTGTAVLTPEAVWSAATRTLTAGAGAGISASDVWSHATRTITGGLVDTTTTLTNAPTVPTPAQIATQVRTELATELARVDVATSTRLASSAYTAPANTDVAAIKAKTDNLPSDPADQSLVVAAITAIPTVAQIRTELDSNSTKLANLDATVSSRLASSVSTNITAIKAKTDLLNTDRLAQCATTSIVGSLIAQSNS